MYAAIQCGPALPSPMTLRTRDCGANRAENGDRMSPKRKADVAASRPRLPPLTNRWFADSSLEGAGSNLRFRAKGANAFGILMPSTRIVTRSPNKSACRYRGQTEPLPLLLAPRQIVAGAFRSAVFRRVNSSRSGMSPKVGDNRIDHRRTEVSNPSPSTGEVQCKPDFLISRKIAAIPIIRAAESRNGRIVNSIEIRWTVLFAVPVLPRSRRRHNACGRAALFR